MAGGSGERFWPLSRPGRPKQLLCLTDPNATMLEEAVRRVQPLLGDNGVYVSASMPLRDPILASQVVASENVLTEPTKRNTLGAQCWVVACLTARGLGDASVAVLTADHLIGDAALFQGCVSTALEIAEIHGGIVTLGIPPTRPETGYGYIEEDVNQSVSTPSGRTAQRSSSFREKPSQTTAEEFLESGRFLWNSGMFFYTIPAFMAELKNAQPVSYEATLAMIEALKAGDEELATKEFEKLPNLSVDYAVMERAEVVYVLRTDFLWDDVGAWDAMERTLPLDVNQNAIQGNVIIQESRGSIVINENASTTVGVLGVTDVVVVVTGDAVLVCPKDQVQHVRNLARAAAERG